jgi:hypothetical protein
MHGLPSLFLSETTGYRALNVVPGSTDKSFHFRPIAQFFALKLDLNQPADRFQQFQSSVIQCCDDPAPPPELGARMRWSG